MEKNEIANETLERIDQLGADLTKSTKGNI